MSGARQTVVGLLVATVAGTAVTVALVNDARIAYRPTRRIYVARTVWIAAALLSGVACAVTIALAGSGMSPAAAARNVALGMGLALPAVVLRRSELFWCAPLLAFGATTIFSRADLRGDSVEWWGMLLNSTWHATDWCGLIVALVAAAAFVAVGTDPRP
ncbi:hypothetical protein PZ938_19925 [Luteipulveratus sp. YIM 133132]|uniref:hypothetical protein n=1 Tax=Luteipulveratus flavus TaxID=3031728 RepID=UPI0023B11A04|nr:hypothetical protein [Luteipulveratus sp. YIM 133132]MDE9367891.1 hypothetical protein [Luteipulveratus sp. YIM 133132]